jgi:SAM-dependent methyltransferase
VANEDQAALWDGPSGDYWVANEERYRRVGRPHLEALLASGPVAPGDAVLDVGCGSGTLTREAARLAGPSGSVLGIDLSGRQLEHARSLSADLPTVRFEHGDAQTMDLGVARFDALVSQFGTMFFDDAAAAFANLARAVRPGGKLTALVWAGPARNEWSAAVQRAILGGDPPRPPEGTPGPFSLADPERVKSLLTGAGFDGVRLDAVEATAAWGDDLEDAYGFVIGTAFARKAFEGLDADGRAAAASRLRELLGSRVTDGGAVVMRAASWLVTARRA